MMVHRWMTTALKIVYISAKVMICLFLPPPLLKEKIVGEVQKLAIISRCPSSPSSLPRYFFQNPLFLLYYQCF